ncbi:hypothetical protein [Haloarcula sp. CBA1127]|uniref:hypothetical protein n=1 Tax=Haloarcula sp. CBA1127 TaxID=1765055 RepID=UPI0012AC1EBF|nr:hypothetical protein [Haloarcula sp. CBA1127]
MSWELTYERGFASAPDDSESALGMVLLMLLDTNRTDEWEDRRKCAAIARDHSDLNVPEIAGLLGMEPMGVHHASAVGEPPWTLTHPEENRRVRLRREIETR